MPVFLALATRPLLWTILLSDWLCSFYSKVAGSALLAGSAFLFLKFLPSKLCMWRHLLFAMVFAHKYQTNISYFWKSLKVFFLQSSDLLINLLIKNVRCFIDFQIDAWRLIMTNEHLLPRWKHLFYKWRSNYWWCCSSHKSIWGFHPNELNLACI